MATRAAAAISIASPLLLLLLLVTFARNAECQPRNASRYEVWASDQSNSVPGQSALGVLGSYLWIWDSKDIKRQLRYLGTPKAARNEAKPLSCSPELSEGPCDILKVFPQDLHEYDSSGESTGAILGQLPAFGRLHGVIHDHVNRYVTVNMYVPGGGFVGVIDVKTKESVGLFRVTSFNFNGGESEDRLSVHMSVWAADGSAIIIANLHGKAIERINVKRSKDGMTIIGLEFDRSATLGLGKDMSIYREASYYLGKNAFGRDLIGSVVGDYGEADLGNLTPGSTCKEDGCDDGGESSPGRPNNLPICPIPSANDNVYITLAGGGLFVADAKSTPMAITAEYSNDVIYGAGCGGVQAGDRFLTNAGVKGSSAGATESMFAVWSFDDTAYGKAGDAYPAPNTPARELVWEDNEANTNTGGNTGSNGGVADETGQIPGETTRRDSHGAGVSVDKKFVHVVDRIQNVVEVFEAKGATSARSSPYSLTTVDGKAGGDPNGACLARSVTDDENLPLNDPAPDLLEETPDGEFMMIAFRGPAPVTVGHSAQGSCPGVGIVKLQGNGGAGKLVDVLRTTNTVPDHVAVDPAGGSPYTGKERSDVHGAAVIPK